MSGFDTSFIQEITGTIASELSSFIVTSSKARIDAIAGISTEIKEEQKALIDANLPQNDAIFQKNIIANINNIFTNINTKLLDNTKILVPGVVTGIVNTGPGTYTASTGNVTGTIFFV